MDKILEWLQNPAIAALIAVVAPLLLSKLNPKVAGILYAVLAALGIKIPASISDKTWDGLGMERHAATASEMGYESLDRLLDAAKSSLAAGDTDNAKDIAEAFVRRSAAINSSVRSKIDG